MKYATASSASAAVLRLSRWLWRHPGMLGACAAAFSAVGLLGSAAFLGKYSDGELRLGLLVYLAAGTASLLYHLDGQRR
jgi:hypothetical protein